MIKYKLLQFVKIKLKITMPVYKQNTKKTTVSFKAAWTYCIYRYVNSIDSFTNDESNAVVFLIV